MPYAYGGGGGGKLAAKKNRFEHLFIQLAMTRLRNCLNLYELPRCLQCSKCFCDSVAAVIAFPPSVMGSPAASAVSSAPERPD